MDNQKTLDDIKEIAYQARPNIQSHLNCNPINPSIAEELENNGLNVEEITGTFSTRRSYIRGESHMFLRIEPSEIQHF